MQDRLARAAGEIDFRFFCVRATDVPGNVTYVWAWRRESEPPPKAANTFGSFDDAVEDAERHGLDLNEIRSRGLQLSDLIDAGPPVLRCVVRSRHGRADAH